MERGRWGSEGAREDRGRGRRGGEGGEGGQGARGRGERGRTGGEGGQGARGRGERGRRGGEVGEGVREARWAREERRRGGEGERGRGGAGGEGTRGELTLWVQNKTYPLTIYGNTHYIFVIHRYIAVLYKMAGVPTIEMWNSIPFSMWDLRRLL